MHIRNQLTSWFSTASRPRPTRRRPRTARLGLESLEARWVPAWTITNLGFEATDINASCQVVGWNGTHAALWHNGITHDLGTLGGGYSKALGINDAGQIVGESTGASYKHAFLINPEDSNGDGLVDRWFRDNNADGRNDLMIDLGTLGGNYDFFSTATDINNAGQVVGTSYGSVSTNYHAFLWQSGAMRDLGTLGGSFSSARAINDIGQVTGQTLDANKVYTTFLWRDGAMTGVGAFEGSADINDDGQIVDHQLLWTPNLPNGTAGTTIDLGTLPPSEFYSGSIYSVALGINSSGRVVGYTGEWVGGGDYDPGGEYRRAFLWTDGVMEELPMDVATAINDVGQIVGGGYLLTPAASVSPRLTINSGSITEGHAGSAELVFTVALSVPVTEVVTVDYSTMDDSAGAGSDYVAATGKLTFAPGETFKTIAVAVIGDTIVEPDEIFQVNLGNAAGATIVDGQAVGTILNDDVALPGLTISDLSKKEGNSGTTTFSFTVTLSGPSSVPVTVQYATADGTATVAGQDYYAKSGTLTFQPGQTSKTISISVRSDKIKEADETFFVNLSAAAGAEIADGQGVGTILNDDGVSTGGKRTSSATLFDAALNDLLNSPRKKQRV